MDHYKKFFRLIPLLILIVCISWKGWAQLDHYQLPNDEKTLDRTANSLFNQQNYKPALAFYLKLDSLSEETRPEYKYRIGVCYLNTRIKKWVAIDYLLSISEENRDRFDEAFYYHLGKAYHVDYQFDKAIEAYNRFLENAGGWGGNKRKKEARRAIKMAKNAKEIVKDTVDVEIENLGATVNSAYMDHTPVISADGSAMYFTSRRPGSIGGLQNIYGEKDTLYGDYYEDIYASIKVGDEWRKPVSIGSNVNSSVHDATIGLSPDGQELFVYRSDSVKWGNIFISKVEGNTWGRLHKLPSPINTQYWEGSASITSDGKILYFSSNRPGGYPGQDRDIYRCRRLPNGEWGKPELLDTATINTPYDDDAPFNHSDGKTLYFSSKGHKSMGGFDIFRTKETEEGWKEPTNVGYPINSPDHEISFSLSADGKRGYYSSAKPGGYGSLDLYVVNMEPKTEAVTLVKGVITGCEEKHPDAEIKVKNKANGKIEGVSRPNSGTGEYLVVLNKGKTYNFQVAAQNHDTFSTTIEAKKGEGYKEIEKDIKLECITAAKDSAVAQKEEKEEKEEKAPTSLKDSGFKRIHFDFDKATITDEARKKLDQLVRFMKKHENINIEVQGYTDAKGSDSYNVRLAKRRASSALEYLVEHNIDQARLSIKSLGEKNPVAPNTKPDGSDNPTGRAKNRRVEFSIGK